MRRAERQEPVVEQGPSRLFGLVGHRHTGLGQRLSLVLVGLASPVLALEDQALSLDAIDPQLERAFEERFAKGQVDLPATGRPEDQMLHGNREVNHAVPVAAFVRDRGSCSVRDVQREQTPVFRVECVLQPDQERLAGRITKNKTQLSSPAVSLGPDRDLLFPVAQCSGGVALHRPQLLEHDVAGSLALHRQARREVGRAVLLRQPVTLALRGQGAKDSPVARPCGLVEGDRVRQPKGKRVCAGLSEPLFAPTVAPGVEHDLIHHHGPATLVEVDGVRAGRQLHLACAHPVPALLVRLVEGFGLGSIQREVERLAVLLKDGGLKDILILVVDAAPDLAFRILLDPDQATGICVLIFEANGEIALGGSSRQRAVDQLEVLCFRDRAWLG